MQASIELFIFSALGLGLRRNEHVPIVVLYICFAMSIQPSVDEYLIVHYSLMVRFPFSFVFTGSIHLALEQFPWVGIYKFHNFSP